METDHVRTDTSPRGTMFYLRQ
uniref:Uncharacterized protein n=1 Tax=Anguilla anguilla TaxID=7936 RepID=A0A0E9TLU0_ANGAN